MLLLAGNFDHPHQLREIIRQTNFLVAVDGGANHAVALGELPAVIMGDLDSVNPDVLRSVPTVIHLPDQALTDAQKALRTIRELGYFQVTIAGLEGDRFDHMLASLSALAAEGEPVRILLRTGFGYVLPPHSTARIGRGADPTASVIPLTPSYPVTLQGFRWNLADVRLAPGELISLSNEINDSEAYLMNGDGAVLLVLLDSSSTVEISFTDRNSCPETIRFA